ncbi:MAG TPA: LemA family protein [Thermoanaerobaculia bacterium]
MRSIGVIGCLIGLVIVVLIFGGWYVGTRNHLVKLDEQVNAQWGQVQNDYQRRYDLIPNLVNTVKGYAAHERETFEAVTNARARVGQVSVPPGPPGSATDITTNPQAMAQYEQAQAGLGNALSRLLVVVERYPELKANQNFLELQSQLEGTENRIAVERKRYNDVARDYNTAIRQFPGSLAASMGGFKPKAYFQVTNPAANEAPKVDFGTTTSK